MSTKLTVWDEMQHMQQRMDDMFESILSREAFPLLEKDAKFMMKRPVSDMYEKNNTLVVDIELPGVDKKDIHVDIDDRGVSVKAEIKTKMEVEEDGIHRLERNYSGYHRYFSLPEGVDASKAKAKYEAGVLHITMPKAKEQISNKKQLKIE